MRKYLFTLLFMFNALAENSLDPRGIVSGVGKPATCDDFLPKEPCQLTCENAAKASKIMGEIGQYLNSIDCDERSCDLAVIDKEINRLIDESLGVEDVRNQDLVKRAILAELSKKMSKASDEIPKELSEEISESLKKNKIQQRDEQFSEEYAEIKNKLGNIDKKIAQFKKAVPEAKKAISEHGYIDAIGQNVNDMFCFFGNCPTEYKSAVTAPGNIEAQIDKDFDEIISSLRKKQKEFEVELNKYTPEYQERQLQNEQTDSVIPSLVEKIESYDKKLSYIMQLRSGVQMNVLLPGVSQVRRAKEGMFDDLIQSDKIAKSVYTTTAATLVAVYTGGLAGTAAMSEGATALSYLGYLGVSGGSTYVAVEGGKDLVGAAIETSGSNISYWCALSQKVPDSQTEVLGQGLIVGGMSMVAGGLLGVGLRSSVNMIKNLSAAGAALLIGYTAKSMVYDTVSNMDRLIDENREAISPMCETVLRSTAAGDVAMDVGAFASFLRIENNARSKIKSNPPPRNGGDSPSLSNSPKKPLKPDPNLKFIPEEINSEALKMGLKESLEHIDAIKFGGNNNKVNIPLAGSDSTVDRRQINNLLGLMADSNFVKECLRDLSIKLDGKEGGDFLRALKNSEFKHLVGEVDIMARSTPGTMRNVGGVYKESGKKGAAQYTHAVRAYLFKKAYEKLNLVDSAGENKITTNSRMNDYFKKMLKGNRDLYDHLFTGKDNKYMYELDVNGNKVINSRTSKPIKIEGQKSNQGPNGVKNAFNDYYLTEIIEKAFGESFDF